MLIGFYPNPKKTRPMPLYPTSTVILRHQHLLCELFLEYWQRVFFQNDIFLKNHTHCAVWDGYFKSVIIGFHFKVRSVYFSSMNELGTMACLKLPFGTQEYSYTVVKKGEK